MQLWDSVGDVHIGVCSCRGSENLCLQRHRRVGVSWAQGWAATKTALVGSEQNLQPITRLWMLRGPAMLLGSLLLLVGTMTAAQGLGQQAGRQE